MNNKETFNVIGRRKLEHAESRGFLATACTALVLYAIRLTTAAIIVN